MKVSVIIPIYNTAQYLEKCISSILKQTYANFELIIINDGSSDHSEDIVNEFLKTGDSRIIYKKLKNGGLSFARNQGLDLASGDYVVFIDTDDWVDPDYIQDFVNNMSLNPKRLIVQDLKEVFPQKTVRNVQGYNNELLRVPMDLSVLISNYRFTQGYAWNKFYNLSLVRDNNIRFVEGPVMNEDELFYMDYIKHIDEIYFLPKDNYNYLQRSNSMTSKLFTFPETVKYLQGLLSFLNYLTSVKKDSPEIKRYAERRINHIFDYALRAAVYGNRYPKNKRIEFLNVLFDKMGDEKKSLKASTFLKQIDYFLFKNKIFSLLDYLLHTKTKYN